MRVLIVGAGAVGGYLGALLGRSGVDVTLVARGERAAAVRQRGLRLRSELHGTFEARPVVVGSVAEAVDAGRGPFELIAVAVKAPDLESVGDDLAAAAGSLFAPGGVALALLNSLDAERVLAARVGPDRVIGGVVFASMESPSPGEVLHTSGTEILVAPLDPSKPERAREVGAFLQANGVAGGFREDLMLLRWRKMIWNSSYNAVSALTNATIDEIARDPGLRSLAAAAMRETIAVAAAEGVAFPDRIVETLLRLGEKSPPVRTSTQQDVQAGRPTEHESLNGAVCRIARRHGIPTPIQDTLLSLLHGRRAAREPG